jgi:hypothetical protein
MCSEPIHPRAQLCRGRGNFPPSGAGPLCSAAPRHCIWDLLLTVVSALVRRTGQRQEQKCKAKCSPSRARGKNAASARGQCRGHDRGTARTVSFFNRGHFLHAPVPAFRPWNKNDFGLGTGGRRGSSDSKSDYTTGMHSTGTKVLYQVPYE